MRFITKDFSEITVADINNGVSVAMLDSSLITVYNRNEKYGVSPKVYTMIDLGDKIKTKRRFFELAEGLSRGNITVHNTTACTQLYRFDKTLRKSKLCYTGCDKHNLLLSFIEEDTRVD